MSLPRDCCSIGDGGLDIERIDGGVAVTANQTGRGRIDFFWKGDSTGTTSASVVIRSSQKPASLTVSPASVSFAVHETATLTASIADANGHSTQGGAVVYWETSDSAVATVDGADNDPDAERGATATVTAAAAGTATITAKHYSTPEVSGTTSVTVTDS